MRLSIIVPFLNEMAVLPELLAHLRVWEQAGCEIILVDGGSRDGGAAWAQEQGFQVLHSSAGRAKQMNLGASAASGELLLFLHADTRLPPNALEVLSKAMTGDQHYWGRFDVKISGQSALLPLIARMINCRSRLSGIATGDQAIFVRRSLLQKLGGFLDQPLMEDIAFSKLAKQHSRPLCLRERVSTSGRRWEKHGVWRTVWLMWRLRWRYWRGEAAERLAAEYRYEK